MPYALLPDFPFRDCPHYLLHFMNFESFQVGDLESGKSQISVELSEERKRREEETMLLARKLAEKTHVADKARQKAIDAENEVRYL